MNNLPILVVFDIDETLLQNMGGGSYKFFNDISLEDRNTIQKSHIEYIDRKYKKKPTGDYYNECTIFRPYLREFLELVKKPNSRIHIAIWTYAEHSYAVKMSEMITNHFGFTKNPFVFTYGDEDMDHKDPKALEQIWDDPTFGKKYNKFNSFLIDDRYANLAHDTNKKNSILCQGFAPFSETKSRAPLTSESLTRSVNDTMFKDLIKIINASIDFIDGCTNQECKDAFENENIFLEKSVKIKKLDKYFKTVKGVNLMTIGDISNSTSEHKGGRKSFKIKRKMKSNKLSKRKRI
jgi:hypothetical protein